MTTTLSASFRMRFFILACGCMALLNACHNTRSSPGHSGVTGSRGSSPEASWPALSLVPLQDTFNAPDGLVAPQDHSGRIFITHVNGRITVLRHDSLLSEPLINLKPFMVHRHRKTFDALGLFAMALHPDFAHNGKFYVLYDAPPRRKADPCRLVLAQFRIDPRHPDRALPGSRKVLLSIENRFTAEEGCGLIFGPDGDLYVGIGDVDTSALGKISPDSAQALGSLLGKVLRINVDQLPYRIPADNPFVHTPGARPEVFAYGLRRPWHFSIDPQSGKLWVGDVGDARREEIDVLKAAGNYGWKLKEGDLDYDLPPGTDTSRLIAPLLEYSHHLGIGIMGGYVYTRKDIPFLQGRYVFGDFDGRLYGLVRDSGTWRMKAIPLISPSRAPLQIFNLGMDAEGHLYILGVRNTNKGMKGVVYRLQAS